MKGQNDSIEQERLALTKAHIEKTINHVEAYRRLYKDNIKDAMSDLDTQESSQNYINVLINTQFVEIANKNYDNLVKALKKPYFARIDFREKGSQQTEQFYIGKTSILKDGEFTPLVVDWRAPISNLYYEGRLGANTYESEGDLYEGELLLKRQITIEAGKLINTIDVDITTNDAFLQASLEASADQRLKDIASTIQAEQNRVIRASMRRPLIVQGAAGSGKTTIALHRIAYFIYTYEKSFNPSNFLIIAPNRLFINYISEVLPELGVENVKQTTYVDFIFECLGFKLKLEENHHKLMTLIKHERDVNAQIELKNMLWRSAFKGSLSYKDGIDAYLNEIEQNYTPSVSFEFFDKVLATRVEIRRLFLEDMKYLPFMGRVNEIKKVLTYRLKQIYPQLLENTHNTYNQMMDDILRKEPPSAQRRTRIIELMDARDTRIKNIQTQNKTAVKQFMQHFPKLDAMTLFESLVTNETLLAKYFGDHIQPEYVQHFVAHALTQKRLNKYELEDLPALLMIQHRVNGFKEPIEISTLVIDEAQDFSLFQIFILKHVLKTSRITLLGDLSQGIHAYRGVSRWDEMIHDVFKDDQPNFMTLEQSYRTTIEIMHLANQVLETLNDTSTIYAKPVIRHGDMPEINYYHESKACLHAMEKSIDELKGKGYKSIAVICKTKEACVEVKKHLDGHKRHGAKILDEKVEQYHAGVIIVPSYFAKGLEFDAVLIVTLKETYTQNPLDVKLLYVAMTRALHVLNIFALEDSFLGINGLSNIEVYNYGEDEEKKILV